MRALFHNDTWCNSDENEGEAKIMSEKTFSEMTPDEVTRWAIENDDPILYQACMLHRTGKPWVECMQAAAMWESVVRREIVKDRIEELRTRKFPTAAIIPHSRRV